jgi:hypothetical protein
MKKNMFFLMLLFVLLFTNMSQSFARPAYMVIGIIILEGRLVRYFPQLYINKCGGTGDDCFIASRAYVGTVGISEGPGGVGTVLDIMVNSIEQDNDVLNEPNESGTVYPSNINYTFPPTSTARITESDDPTWIGLQWDISGQTTDGNGKLYKYFPF